MLTDSGEELSLVRISVGVEVINCLDRHLTELFCAKDGSLLVRRAILFLVRVPGLWGFPSPRVTLGIRFGTDVEPTQHA